MKKLLALILSLTMIVVTVPAVKSEASTIYTIQGSSVSDDTLVSNQWGLENDGSFTVETQKSGYSGNPCGRRNRFGFGMFAGGWFGNTLTETLQAVEGIDVNAQEAWDIYAEAEETREVIIALIDTGVDYTHEDLKDSIWINEDEIPNNGIDDDNNGYIDDYYGWNFYNNSNRVYQGSEDEHGTHGAGTIAASIDNGTGVASVAGNANVKIMILKALGGSEGSGTTEAVVEAIKYAEANGASIVNLSLGSTEDDDELYNVIASSDMLFVVAAGNGDSRTGIGTNTDSTPTYPASYDLDNIISVANISYDGTLDSSSNYGSNSVDLAAPGTYIMSTTPGNDYGYLTGTSMSAPFVSAAVAMVYSYYTDISLADAQEIVLNSVTKLDSLTGKCATGGLLNVAAALQYDLSELSGEGWSEAELREIEEAPSFGFGNMPGGDFGSMPGGGDYWSRPGDSSWYSPNPGYGRGGRSGGGYGYDYGPGYGFSVSWGYGF